MTKIEKEKLTMTLGTIGDGMGLISTRQIISRQ